MRGVAPAREVRVEGDERDERREGTGLVHEVVEGLKVASPRAVTRHQRRREPLGRCQQKLRLHSLQSRSSYCGRGKRRRRRRQRQPKLRTRVREHTTLRPRDFCVRFLGSRSLARHDAHDTLSLCACEFVASRNALTRSVKHYTTLTRARRPGTPACFTDVIACVTGCAFCQGLFNPG